MGTPTIIKGEEYFNTVIYEGNGTGQRVGNFIPFTNQATIANSCIFNASDSPKLTYTPSGSGDKQKFSFSCWYKPVNTATRRVLYAVYHGNNGRYANIQVDDNDRLQLQSGAYTSGSSTSTVLDFISNRTLEDSSKFYNIVAIIDTTQSTEANRVKIYIDGDQITSWNTATYPTQNDNLYYGTEHSTIISSFDGSQFYADGYLAEINYVNGQALTPASFGITDTSTGRWIPKAVEPHPTTTTDIAVTVVSSGGNKYALDGVTQGTVTLIEGATYKFDQSDSSNSGHPLRFSTTSDGTHGGGSEFTSGVTTAGTPGSSGAYTQITVPVGTATLYYYCTQHSGMGGTANTQDQYGTNGFRLVFAQSNDLGDDTSGKGNDFAETGLTTADQTTDSPTLNRNNMGGSNNSFTLSEGNLKVVSPGSGAQNQCVGLESMGVSTGKWYWEVKINSKGACGYGWKSDSNVGGSQAISSGTGSRGTIYNVGGSGGFADGEWTDDWVGGTSNFSPFTTASNDDVVMFALDLDNRRGYVGLNGTWFNSANPANGTGSIGLGKVTVHAVASKFYPMACRLDASGTGTYNFGGTSFAHTPPTGFLNWNQTTMPEKDEGISSFVWAKNRDNGNRGHQLYDSSRGPLLTLYSNGTNAESTNTDSLQKFLKGGFSAEDFTGLNEASESHVAWNWVANAGTTASNTNGSITSTVQANTTSGFSIVKYTGSGSAATIGHGLSTAPTFIVVKNLDDTSSWYVYINATRANNANTYYMRFDSDDSQSDTGAVWNDTTPTSTVFSVGGEDTSNKASTSFVAYCFTDVDAFSKIGQYSGNNNNNGPFIYTGFKPSFVLIKGLDVGNHWVILDSTRSPINPVQKALKPNLSQAEDDDANMAIDFVSNGFKIRGGPSGDGGNINGSYLYGYMAFAEAPFIGDGVSPVTAR